MCGHKLSTYWGKKTTPESEVARSYGKSVFSFVRNCRTVFRSGCAIVHSQGVDGNIREKANCSPPSTACAGSWEEQPLPPCHHGPWADQPESPPSVTAPHTRPLLVRCWVATRLGSTCHRSAVSSLRCAAPMLAWGLSRGHCSQCPLMGLTAQGTASLDGLTGKHTDGRPCAKCSLRCLI